MVLPGAAERAGRLEKAALGAVAKWLGIGLQNRHTWVQIPSAPPKYGTQAEPCPRVVGESFRSTRAREPLVARGLIAVEVGSAVKVGKEVQPEPLHVRALPLAGRARL